MQRLFLRDPRLSPPARRVFGGGFVVVVGVGFGGGFVGVVGFLGGGGFVGGGFFWWLFFFVVWVWGFLGVGGWWGLLVFFGGGGVLGGVGWFLGFVCFGFFGGEKFCL